MVQRFEELLDRHHDELFAYLWRLLGRERYSDVSLDAEDLTQEAFMRAYEAFPRLRAHSNHRAWLYKIATNCAFTRLRQIRERRQKMLALASSADARSHPCIRENFGPARDIVDGLPVKQKACLILRYLDDLDYSEIAEIVGCSDASARANVYQAIRSLRRALKEE
jgi:RNA polymerase sigma-70 factor (ECF subfamily)